MDEGESGRRRDVPTEEGRLMQTGWFTKGNPANVMAALGLLAARDAMLERGAVELQTEWKTQLNQPGSGRVYPAGEGFITKGGKLLRLEGSASFEGRKATHRASAPGESPARDTGNLSKAVQVARDGGDWRVGMGGKIGRVGLALEFGVNVSGSRVGPHPAGNFQIAPRPHARPAIARWKQRIAPDLRNVMRSNLKTPRLQGGVQ